MLTPAYILVGHYLKLFEVHFPQMLKDTMSLVKQMENIVLPQDILFITMDVDSLYTNIPISEAVNAVKDLFYQFAIPQGDLLLALLIAILNLNLMEFNGEYYLQLEGLGMGSSLAVVFLANIFVGIKEKDFGILLQQEILLYRRLIDDILVLWNGSMDSAIAFVDKVNNMGKTLKVTKKISFHEMDFLDILMHKGERFLQYGVLDLKVYQKPINLYLYIAFSSEEPLHAKKGLIKTELIRYVRICFNELSFQEISRD